jgi:hypothetical protein
MYLGTFSFFHYHTEKSAVMSFFSFFLGCLSV